MERMPALFIGHGSPMNAVEKNEFTVKWLELGKTLPRPKAILSVSAHWYVDGTRVSDEENPRTIHDMYGFPDELYRIVYGAKGSPYFANAAKELLGGRVKTDNSWGLDHGTWSVLRRMYPTADVPVFQLSVDAKALLDEHFEIGRAIAPLRDMGVMVFGSGNIVHNLRRVNWEMENGGYPLAYEFDVYIKEKVLSRDFEGVINYKNAGDSANFAFETPDHFAPLLYVLGAAREDDGVETVCEGCAFGSISMTGYLFK